MKKRTKITGTQKLKAVDKLIENITQYPQNIQAAIRLTAKETKFNPNTLSRYYYGTYPTKRVVNKKVYTQKAIPGIKDVTPIIIMHTKKGMLINNKSIGVLNESGKQLKLNTALHKMEDLTTEQKAAWFDIILNK